MIASARPLGKWDKVEKTTSQYLLAVLICVLGMRLGFDGVWHMPPLDFTLCVVALVLVVGSFWFARDRRNLRIAVIAFGAGTQLVPMVVRDPILLLPLLGGLIPVAVLFICVVALSKKDKADQLPPRS
ncbi:MAG: LrgA [Rhodanobacter sp.]